MTAPPKIMAATGLDALCHAVKLIHPEKHRHYRILFAMSAVKRIFKIPTEWHFTMERMKKQEYRCL